MEFLHPVMWHDHDIDFARWLQPAMWQVALGWHAIKFAKTSAILEFYFWFRFRPYHRCRHVILHQSAKFYPNRTTLRRKMTSCRFSRWRISAILDFGSNNRFFEKPMYDFLKVVNRYHGSKLLSFWENRVFAFWRQTNRWTGPLHEAALAVASGGLIN